MSAVRNCTCGELYGSIQPVGASRTPGPVAVDGVEPTERPWLRLETTILSIADGLRAAYDRRFAPLGLNLSQATIIAYLDEFGPTIQTRLADHLGHGRAATGTCIDRMERAGLVRRTHDPSDRRVWLVQLTTAGSGLAPQIAAVDADMRAAFRAGVNRDERHVLGEALGRLDRNIRADRVVGTANHT
jgi:DNA-binding MarR family transcriptional regulator